jgi:hypothetical protein
MPKKIEKIETVDVDMQVIESNAEPSLYEQVTSWLDDKDWRYQGADKQDFVSFGLGLKDASVRVNCWLYDAADWKRIIVCTVFPTRVPAHRRAEVALALARINYATGVGCFEMDVDDGEVRTRTWHESEKRITEEMMDRVFRRSLDIADQFQAPLLSIAFGNAPAAQVIEMAKQGDQTTIQ